MKRILNRHDLIRQKRTETNWDNFALTANALSGDKGKYMNEGMDDYTTKPLDVKAIEALVDKCCRG